MPQHDLVIDNAPGIAVRTDIVAALQALASLSSGAIEPATKYAGMFWLDSSVAPNGSVKMRNLSNTAWVQPAFYGDDRVAEIAYFARSSPPTGWLKANGNAVSRTTYATLFAVIGTQFGVGDGSTTFNLPDMRGQFMRAWDDGRGLDAARAFGSDQSGGIQNHIHPATTVVAAGGSHSHSGNTGINSVGHTHGVAIVTDAQGTHAHNIQVMRGDGGAGGTIGSATFGDLFTNKATDPAGAHQHNVNGNTGGQSVNHTHAIPVEPAHGHTATTTTSNPATGLAETRPTNVALLACIRYA